MTTPAIEREQQAIEAAINAAYSYHSTNGFNGTTRGMVRAAISAFLAASGVGRDAERYRWLRMNRLWLKANLPMLAAPQFDAAIDAAMAREGE